MFIGYILYTSWVFFWDDGVYDWMKKYCSSESSINFIVVHLESRQVTEAIHAQKPKELALTLILFSCIYIDIHRAIMQLSGLCGCTEEATLLNFYFPHLHEIFF